MFTFRFLYQSRKLCSCEGMLQTGCSAPAHVIAIEASPNFISPHYMTVPDSFKKYLVRLSTVLPIQRYKPRRELLERMIHVRSLFSGSHLSRLNSNSFPGKDLFNIIKSASYEIEGPSHCWLNSNYNANKFFDHEGIFLVLVNAFIQDDSLNGHQKQTHMIEGVKFLQKRYPKLNVTGLQCVCSSTSVMIHSKMLKIIMEEYITFPILFIESNLIEMEDSAVHFFCEGSKCHSFYFNTGAEIGDIVKAIDELSSLQKKDMSEKLNSSISNEHITIEEPTASSIFKNLLLSYSGTLSVDEDSGRIFLSDSNHHRIIIADGDGKILDLIGSSPGFVDADFEAAQLCCPAASFYNVSDGCLYFVDSENNAIRRADMERRVVETMYPVPQAKDTWSQITGLWNRILKSFGFSKDKKATVEVDFDPITSPWHLLNLEDDELIIVSHSFAVAWIMSMTTWKIKEVIRGFQIIFEKYGNVIMDKLSSFKDACSILPHKFTTQTPWEKIPYAMMSSVANIGDDIIIYDAACQSLLKYNIESMDISHIKFSNLGLLGLPYWFYFPVEKVFKSNCSSEQAIEHTRNFSVLPGRCDISVNVKIPENTILAAPLDENCIWRQARGSAAEVSGSGDENIPEEKVGVAQQWYDELDNLAFSNPELESLDSTSEVIGKATEKNYQNAENIQFNCAVNASPGTSEVIVSAALYLKPNPALSFKEAARLVNPGKQEQITTQSECLSLFLEKHGNTSNIVFTKPLHLRIKLECGDHPAALTTKETILTDTRLQVDLILE